MSNKVKVELDKNKIITKHYKKKRKKDPQGATFC